MMSRNRLSELPTGHPIPSLYWKHQPKHLMDRRLNQLFADTSRPPVEEWNHAICHSHGAGVTLRPSPTWRSRWGQTRLATIMRLPVSFEARFKYLRIVFKSSHFHNTLGYSCM